MEKINVLITSAGVTTAINVITALKSSKKFTFRIIAVDMNKYSAGLYLSDKFFLVPPLNNPNYLDQILEICLKEKISIVFPLFSKEIIIFSRNFQKFYENNIKLMLPTPETVELCDNKLHFYNFLETLGLDYPRIYNYQTYSYNFPLFMKPIQGSSTKNAVKIENEKDLEYYRSKYPNHLIQEFIEGKEYTVDCLGVHGETIVAIPRLRISVKDGKSIVGKTVKHSKIIEICKLIIKETNFHGPCNIQIIEESSGRLCLIEMNPRLAAGGLPLAVNSGANIPELIVDYLMGNNIRPIDNYRENVVMIRYFQEIFFDEN